MPRQRSPAARETTLGAGELSPDLEKALGVSKPIQQRKYRNQPVDLDGHHFDSKAEAARYITLIQRLKAGEICCLEVHPRFPLVVHGQDCGVYIADFSYVERGSPVIEDVKSPATRKLPTYRLKRKLVWALYGVDVREV